jgi:hypothetical protein
LTVQRLHQKVANWRCRPKAVLANCQERTRLTYPIADENRCLNGLAAELLLEPS